MDFDDGFFHNKTVKKFKELKKTNIYLISSSLFVHTYIVLGKNVKLAFLSIEILIVLYLTIPTHEVCKEWKI